MTMRSEVKLELHVGRADGTRKKPIYQPVTIHIGMPLDILADDYFSKQEEDAKALAKILRSSLPWRVLQLLIVHLVANTLSVNHKVVNNGEKDKK